MAEACHVDIHDDDTLYSFVDLLTRSHYSFDVQSLQYVNLDCVLQQSSLPSSLPVLDNSIIDQELGTPWTGGPKYCCMNKVYSFMFDAFKEQSQTVCCSCEDTKSADELLPVRGDVDEDLSSCGVQGSKQNGGTQSSSVASFIQPRYRYYIERFNNRSILWSNQRSPKPRNSISSCSDTTNNSYLSDTSDGDSDYISSDNLSDIFVTENCDNLNFKIELLNSSRSDNNSRSGQQPDQEQQVVETLPEDGEEDQQDRFRSVSESSGWGEEHSHNKQEVNKTAWSRRADKVNSHSESTSEAVSVQNYSDSSNHVQFKQSGRGEEKTPALPHCDSQGTNQKTGDRDLSTSEQNERDSKSDLGNVAFAKTRENVGSSEKVAREDANRGHVSGDTKSSPDRNASLPERKHNASRSTPALPQQEKETFTGIKVSCNNVCREYESTAGETKQGDNKKKKKTAGGEFIGRITINVTKYTKHSIKTRVDIVRRRYAKHARESGIAKTAGARKDDTYSGERKGKGCEGTSKGDGGKTKQNTRHIKKKKTGSRITTNHRRKCVKYEYRGKDKPGECTEQGACYSNKTERRNNEQTKEIGTVCKDLERERNRVKKPNEKPAIPDSCVEERTLGDNHQQDTKHQNQDNKPFRGARCEPKPERIQKTPNPGQSQNQVGQNEKLAQEKVELKQRNGNGESKHIGNPGKRKSESDRDKTRDRIRTGTDQSRTEGHRRSNHDKENASEKIKSSSRNDKQVIVDKSSSISKHRDRHESSSKNSSQRKPNDDKQSAKYKDSSSLNSETYQHKTHSSNHKRETFHSNNSNEIVDKHKNNLDNVKPHKRKHSAERNPVEEKPTSIVNSNSSNDSQASKSVQIKSNNVYTTVNMFMHDENNSKHKDSITCKNDSTNIKTNKSHVTVKANVDKSSPKPASHSINSGDKSVSHTLNKDKKETSPVQTPLSNQSKCGKDAKSNTKDSVVSPNQDNIQTKDSNSTIEDSSKTKDVQASERLKEECKKIVEKYLKKKKEGPSADETKEPTNPSTPPSDIVSVNKETKEDDKIIESVKKKVMNLDEYKRRKRQKASETGVKETNESNQTKDAAIQDHFKSKEPTIQDSVKEKVSTSKTDDPIPALPSKERSDEITIVNGDHKEVEYSKSNKHGSERMPIENGDVQLEKLKSGEKKGLNDSHHTREHIHQNDHSNIRSNKRQPEKNTSTNNHNIIENIKHENNSNESPDVQKPNKPHNTKTLEPNGMVVKPVPKRNMSPFILVKDEVANVKLEKHIKREAHQEVFKQERDQIESKTFITKTETSNECPWSKIQSKEIVGNIKESTSLFQTKIFFENNIESAPLALIEDTLVVKPDIPVEKTLISPETHGEPMSKCPTNKQMSKPEKMDVVQHDVISTKEEDKMKLLSQTIENGTSAIHTEPPPVCKDDKSLIKVENEQNNGEEDIVDEKKTDKKECFAKTEGLEENDATIKKVDPNSCVDNDKIGKDLNIEVDQDEKLTVRKNEEQKVDPTSCMYKNHMGEDTNIEFDQDEKPTVGENEVDQSDDTEEGEIVDDDEDDDENVVESVGKTPAENIKTNTPVGASEKSVHTLKLLNDKYNYHSVNGDNKDARDVRRCKESVNGDVKNTVVARDGGRRRCKESGGAVRDRGEEREHARKAEEYERRKHRLARRRSRERKRTRSRSRSTSSSSSSSSSSRSSSTSSNSSSSSSNSSSSASSSSSSGNSSSSSSSSSSLSSSSVSSSSSLPFSLSSVSSSSSESSSSSSSSESPSSISS
uniref:Uncharacterized protein n=1 Tax=Cacopsylla melanoneura TaxID=428564 RepID=A0A8D9AE41_9HEMI